MNKRVTSTEFQQSFEALSASARQEPVMITRHGSDDLVVVSAGVFKRLKQRERLTGLAEDLPQGWVEAVRAAKVPDEFAWLDDELL